MEVAMGAMVDSRQGWSTWGWMPAVLVIVSMGCASAAHGDGAADAQVTCGAGFILCLLPTGRGHACADVAHDPENCGACDRICVGGQSCVAGTCTTSCASPSVACGVECVDLQVDPANCGACGHGCPAGSLCTGGECVSFCAAGMTVCSASCVDLQTDVHDCGACGTVCPAGDVCTAGTCAEVLCSGALTNCGGRCVDLSTDDANCGACGSQCPMGQACLAGVCACPSGTTACGLACVDTSTDVANCGGCSRRCMAGSVCAAGTCPLAPSSWSFDGNDAQHTGFNAEEPGHPPLALAWSAPIGAASLGSAVVEDGRVFVSSSGYFGASQLLVAYDATTGIERWRYDFGNVFSVGHPAVLDGRVYIAQSSNSGDTYLFAFAASDGTLAYRTPFGSQWEIYYSPIVQDGRVYLDGGEYGGLYAFGAVDGAQLFFTPLAQYDSWSPGFWGAHVYTFIDGVAQEFDPLAGTIASSFTVPWNWVGYSMHTWPAFDDTAGYIISPPNLYAFDPVAMRTTWTANGAFSGAPTVNAGVVYALSGGTLMARDAGTGALLWTFLGDGALDHPAVVAAGTVYVASDANVYAVDVASHTMAWTAATGGWLSIGAGQLLVAGHDGTLHAYALTP